jgi:hypothetical protein
MRQQRHVERGCAGVYRHRVASAHVTGKFLLETLDTRSRGNPTGPDDIKYLAYLFFTQARTG